MSCLNFYCLTLGVFYFKDAQIKREDESNNDIFSAVIG